MPKFIASRLLKKCKNFFLILVIIDSRILDARKTCPILKTA